MLIVSPNIFVNLPRFRLAENCVRMSVEMICEYKMYERAVFAHLCYCRSNPYSGLVHDI